MAQVINMSTSLPGFSENYFCYLVAEPEATRNKLGYQGFLSNFDTHCMDFFIGVIVTVLLQSL